MSEAGLTSQSFMSWPPDDSVDGFFNKFANLGILRVRFITFAHLKSSRTVGKCRRALAHSTPQRSTDVHAAMA
jgi:hypothetical protein